MEPIKSMLWLTVVITLVLIKGEASSSSYDNNDEALEGCQKSCGGVQVRYPFGIGNSSTTGKSCYLAKRFNVTCDNSTLITGNIPVLDINIPKGQFELLLLISDVCYNIAYGDVPTYGEPSRLTSSLFFAISSRDNKFVSVGCDTYGYLNRYYNDGEYSTGCLTRCYGHFDGIVDGNCSGIGCCQVDIPDGMRNISVQTFSFENFNRSLGFNECGYSFVVKNGNYTFSRDHLKNLPFERLPVVFDWTVGGGESCKESISKGSNVCKGNSTCVDSDTRYGYQCQCREGFQGNPYHPNGCIDIDECQTPNHNCMSRANCINTIGSYQCFCPNGQSGNGTKEDQCRQQNFTSKIVIVGSAGFVAIFVAISLSCFIYQKRKLIKLKEKFFKQNGGFILLQQFSHRESSSQAAKIFTADELKKATNNFDEKLILGKGGYGTVFKGFLPDNRIVAVKKSKMVDQSQVEQFINEVIVLSQINHRNVVKLLGCCLETEVPLLVYEFVNNGTLYEFIHNESNANNVTWENRLRIAAEAAGAFSYLHSSASIPIVHRDVKSANILLDNTYTAKVSDFGASRLVPIDQAALATMVQGTIGYLDPEYMQTSRLTEKSDVYSFGVVLVELLTGEKPLSFDRSEDNRSLAIYFLSCLKEDRLFEVVQVGILSEENKQEIVEVAVLAAKCLRLNGEERPSMKEVAAELEGIMLMQKHYLIHADKIVEDTQPLIPKLSFEICEHGDSSSSHQNTGTYDSIRDQVLVEFDDGR